MIVECRAGRRWLAWLRHSFVRLQRKTRKIARKWLIKRLDQFIYDPEQKSTQCMAGPRVRWTHSPRAQIRSKASVWSGHWLFVSQKDSGRKFPINLARLILRACVPCIYLVYQMSEPMISYDTNQEQNVLPVKCLRHFHWKFPENAFAPKWPPMMPRITNDLHQKPCRHILIQYLRCANLLIKPTKYIQSWIHWQ